MCRRIRCGFVYPERYRRVLVWNHPSQQMKKCLFGHYIQPSLWWEEEEFSGGDIEYRPDLFDDVKSYATTFYTLKDGEKNVILSNSIDDQAGISIQVETNLGKISGPNIISESVEKIDDIEENLWFELTIKYKNGEDVSAGLIGPFSAG